MKTNTTLAILLMGIILLMFGCKQQTATQVAAQQGEWVEITDVNSLPDIRMGSNTYGTWEPFAGLAVRDTLEFLALATMIDTSDISQKEYYHKYPPVLPITPDFSQYSMVGLLTYTGSVNYTRKFFVNNTLQQYRLLISLEKISLAKILKQSQNWLRVPHLKQGYTVIFDTTTVHPGM